MNNKEQLRECWSDAISHCEDRLRGSLPVYKNFEDWYKANLVTDKDLAIVSDRREQLISFAQWLAEEKEYGKVGSVGWVDAYLSREK